MSIRIRVYPQPNSVGARRNRAIRQQQQLIRRQQLQLALIRQQQAQQFQPYGSFGGYGGYGSTGGFAPSFGTSSYFPSASSWGVYGANTSQVCPPASSCGGSAYYGAGQLGYGANAYATTSYASPFGVAQYAGSGFGWFGGGW